MAIGDLSEDLTGRQFGRWHVVKKAPPSPRYEYYHCRCECGRSRPVAARLLRNGTSTSCGCSHKGRNVTHGGSVGGQSPEYIAWNNMLRRCRNPNSPEWHNYGGRGIRVCDEWNDFAVFIRDMGPRPAKGYTLERIDNDGHYAATNCEWRTYKAQMNNQRRTVRLTYQGETLPIAEWANRTGIPQATLRNRAKQGWDIERLLTLPYQAHLAVRGPETIKPPKPPRQPVTHCKHGHEFSEANTYWTSEGKRQCKECQHRRRQERWAAIKKERPEPAPATHCERGHLFDAANTRIDKRGHRSCIACRKITRLAHKERTGRWL